MRHGWGSLLLVALLATQGAHAWAQVRGGPDHNGLLPIPPGPKDVVAAFDLFGPAGTLEERWENDTSLTSVFWSPVLVESSDGYLGLWHDRLTGACTLYSYAELPGAMASSRPLEGCAGPTLQGYDPASDQVLLCQPGNPDQPVLLAYDARTGAVNWDIVPARDFDGAAFLGVPPNPADASRFLARWACLSAAMDPQAGEVVAGFYFNTPVSPQNRLAAIDLATGQVRWSRLLPLFTLLTNVGTRDGGAGSANFAPQTVTLTTTGIVVTGVMVCGFCGSTTERAVMWLTREGAVVGGTVSFEPRNGHDDPSRGGSKWAAASEGRAVFALGTRIVLVDPQTQEVIQSGDLGAHEPLTALCSATSILQAEVREQVFSASDTSCNQLHWEPPVWWKGTIVVPVVYSVNAYDATDLQKKWDWIEGPDWRITDLAMTAQGNVLVLIARGGPNLTEALLVRLDAETGRVLQRIPLPAFPNVVVQSFAPGGAPLPVQPWNLRIVPLEGRGVLVVSDEGDAVLLGEAEPGLLPSLGLSDPFPLPGRRVTLDLRMPPGVEVAKVIVNWGEGAPEELAPAEQPTHVYDTPGLYQVVATAVYADGRTATSTALVDVGGQPPEELTALQTAFAPENLDLTFGMMGLLVAGAGGVYTLSRRRRHHGRLQEDLEMLERIRAEGLDDPGSVVRRLEAYRRKIQMDLAEGRLQDGHYSMLELQVARLLRASRNRLLAPYEDKLSHRFQRLLDAVLEDGMVNPAEAGTLLAAAKDEKRLSAREREELARLLEGWSSEA